MFPNRSDSAPSLNSMERRQSIAGRATGLLERIGANIDAVKKKSATLPLPQDNTIYSMNPEDYEINELIGQGSSAMVYLANYKILNKPVSMKVIELDMFERNQIDELRRELQIMTLSKHPNLLPVHGSFVNGSKLFIITPFLSAGSGLDIMKTAFKNGMEETVIATILKQVLQGLDYLHTNGLIHRDIKAGNLLVNNDGLVQLADFGVSSSLTDHGARNTSRKTFVGTPCWMAPEVMDQSGYNYKADIWSFGITALELANGHAPYAKYPPLKVLMLTINNSPPTLERDKTHHKYSKSFKDMIDLCLQKDPVMRPTAEKLLNHPFFKSAKKPVYLVTTLLNGLTPITERQHRQQSNYTEANEGDDHHDDWDFDDGSPGNDRHESFQLQTGVKPAESKTDSAVSNAVSNNQDAKAVKFVTEPISEKAFGPMSEKSGSTSDTVSTTSSLPRKSRFVVDNNRLNPAQTRMENVNSDSQMAPAVPPLIQQQSMGEVRKGRFSVMDSNPSSTTSQTASNSAPNVNTSVSEQPSTGQSAAVVVSQNTCQVLTMDESLVNSPLDSTIGSTTSTLERKAGRFAFQNIPTSAVTSPKLTPTEGIKLPRKFTVTNETNSSTHSSPTTANPPQNNNDTTSSTSDKRGRFQIIGSNPTGETLSHPLLAQAQAPLPLNLTDSEKLSFLLKQNEVQRIIIQDIIGVLNKNGLSVATPSRASSTDSNELKQ